MATVKARNACVACRHGKRRCDRGQPKCTTCSRTGRDCAYDTDIAYFSAVDSDNSSSENPISTHATPSSSSYQPTSGQGVSVGPGLIDIAIDPFRLEPLRRLTVDSIARKELLGVVGSMDNMRRVASSYFASISPRLPILSPKRFLERLPSITSPGCTADFATLCLGTCLIVEVPTLDATSMQSSLYVKVKGILSLLEASSYHSLEEVQCRIIVAFYEMGHGIYPAAAASIGAAAKVARLLGLHRDLPDSRPGEAESYSIVEERRRTLWGLHNLDRYVNLCTQECLFTLPYPRGEDPLPIEERLWEQDMASAAVTHTLNTPSDVTIGTFARECQICHLVGRVLRNVYEPTSDASFQTQEAEQLEATMLAFIPLLREHSEDFGKYCISFAICSSALFTLYGSSLESYKYDEDTKAKRSALLEKISLEITHYCRRLFEIEDEINFNSLSPLVPYAIYQATVIQLRLIQPGAAAIYAENVEYLKKVLGHYTRIWLIAGKYRQKLEMDSPPLLVSAF
ncbi:hypothetical protein GQ53DRAFT_742980 [Thozetella sp. PMI_491]|nr:hypothetical protein GQ53DRAFT_742980 [Thozetella sp. PMI_491]